MSEQALGFIGGPMAGRLLDASYSLLIFDVCEQAYRYAIAAPPY